MPQTKEKCRQQLQEHAYEREESLFSKQANYTKQIRAEESYLNNRFQGNLSTQKTFKNENVSITSAYDTTKISPS